MVALRSFVAVFAMTPMAAGHGWMVEPPARNAKPSGMNANTPQGGNGKRSVCGDGGSWASGSNFVGTPEAPVRTYKAGQIVKFVLEITAQHGGHHDFHICDSTISSDTGAVECLQKWPLERVRPEELYSGADACQVNDKREDCQPIDANYPGRWYDPDDKKTLEIHYRIPANLQCDKCTLHWFWPTGNSNPYDVAAYSCYNKQLSELGWSWKPCSWQCSDAKCPTPYAPAGPISPVKRTSFEEEFRNCADIAVIGTDSSVQDDDNSGAQRWCGTTSIAHFLLVILVSMMFGH